MLRRIGPRRALLLAALALGTAACDDESPTLSSDPFFPGGTLPVTREVILPAGTSFRTLGTFSGFTGPNSDAVGFRLVANQFAGELSARTLLRTARAFPRELRYTQDNVNRTDSLFRGVSASLVLRVDSLGSTPGPVTLRVYQLAQPFDPGTVTYEVASDTGGVRTPWRERGGTRGALLGSAEYTASAAGDSLVVELDSAALSAIRDTTGFGVVFDVAQAGSRLQINDLPALRARFRPSNAVRDTVVETPVELAGQAYTFVFTPEAPQLSSAIVAGGLRSARTLFRFQLPDSVPGCSPPQSCARVALRDVRLNRLSVLLRREAVPAAFTPRDTAIFSVFSVSEPELGRRAPLGSSVLEVDPRIFIARGSLVQPQRAALLAPADTVLELNLTSFAALAASGDTVPTSFALLGGPGVGVGSQRLFDAFGVAAFRPEPRLRIVYTLPVRTELP